ncbi:unnamed protein product, partial [Polarella glacialis]
DIDLPYYFSVLGLDNQPGGTVVKPGPRGIGLRVNLQGNTTNQNTFWRSIENLRIAQDRMEWFVSQAAPMRSVILDGDLVLSGPPPDWTSGGCLANSRVNGQLDVGTQQQWYTKSTAMNPYPHASSIGSYVCVGCTQLNGQPYNSSYDWDVSEANGDAHTGLSYTEAPEVSAEKPYIYYDKFLGNKYMLAIPAVRNDHWGPDWQTGSAVPFERVYV